MLTQIEKGLQRITLDISPPGGLITLAHPPANVIDLRMLDELLAAIEQLDQRPDISFFVVAGNAQAFSSGVEVAVHTAEHVRAMLTKLHSVIRALVATKKITLAAVRGRCLGGGAELALACDMIFCTENSIWQFPEISLGCFPGGFRGSGASSRQQARGGADSYRTGDPWRRGIPHGFGQ